MVLWGIFPVRVLNIKVKVEVFTSARIEINTYIILFRNYPSYSFIF